MLVSVKIWKFLALVLCMPYSGSRYPTVPRTMLETCEVPSTANFDNPKSETFALMCLSSKMLLVLRSRCMIAGTHPV